MGHLAAGLDLTAGLYSAAGLYLAAGLEWVIRLMAGLD